FFLEVVEGFLHNFSHLWDPCGRYGVMDPVPHEVWTGLRILACELCDGSCPVAGPEPEDHCVSVDFIFQVYLYGFRHSRRIPEPVTDFLLKQDDPVLHVREEFLHTLFWAMEDDFVDEGPVEGFINAPHYIGQSFNVGRSGSKVPIHCSLFKAFILLMVHEVPDARIKPSINIGLYYV